jgi:hypothetical protein
MFFFELIYLQQSDFWFNDSRWSPAEKSKYALSLLCGKKSFWALTQLQQE